MNYGYDRYDVEDETFDSDPHGIYHHLVKDDFYSDNDCVADEVGVADESGDDSSDEHPSQNCIDSFYKNVDCSKDTTTTVSYPPSSPIMSKPGRFDVLWKEDEDGDGDNDCDDFDDDESMDCKENVEHDDCKDIVEHDDSDIIVDAECTFEQDTEKDCECRYVTLSDLLVASQNEIPLKQEAILNISTSPLTLQETAPTTGESIDSLLVEEEEVDEPEECSKTDKQMESIRRKRAKKKANDRLKKIFPALNAFFLESTRFWSTINLPLEKSLFQAKNDNLSCYYVFEPLPTLQEQYDRFISASELHQSALPLHPDEPRCFPCSESCGCKLESLMAILYPTDMPVISGVNDLLSSSTFIQYDTEDISTFIKLFLPELRAVKSAFLERVISNEVDPSTFLSAIIKDLPPKLHSVLLVFLRHPKLFLLLDIPTVRNQDTKSFFGLIASFSEELSSMSTNDRVRYLLKDIIRLGDSRALSRKRVSFTAIKKYWQKVLLVAELLSENERINNAFSVLAAKGGDQYYVMGGFQSISYEFWLNSSALYEGYREYQKRFNGLVHLMYLMRSFAAFSWCQLDVVKKQLRGREMETIYLVHSICKRNVCPFEIYVKENIISLRDVIENTLHGVDVEMIVLE